VLTNATGLPISSGVSGLGANIATFLATPTSANFAFAVTDETGSGNVVLSNNPVLVTPNIGTPSAGVLTNATGLGETQFIPYTPKEWSKGEFRIGFCVGRKYMKE
jgi:hypothetical protein